MILCLKTGSWICSRKCHNPQKVIWYRKISQKSPKKTAVYPFDKLCIKKKKPLFRVSPSIRSEDLLQKQTSSCLTVRNRWPLGFVVSIFQAADSTHVGSNIHKTNIFTCCIAGKYGLCRGAWLCSTSGSKSTVPKRRCELKQSLEFPVIQREPEL